MTDVEIFLKMVVAYYNILGGHFRRGNNGKRKTYGSG
jgi:hypothetical protein